MSVSLPTIEDYQKVMEEIASLRRMIETVSIGMCAPRVVNVADIARMERVSRTQVEYKEVYLLPNFGISEYPEGTKRWNYETYVNWRAIPPEKRLDMYHEYLDNIQKRNWDLLQAQKKEMGEAPAKDNHPIQIETNASAVSVEHRRRKHKNG